MQSERLTIKSVEGARDGERLLKLRGPLILTTLFDFQDAMRAEKAGTVILDLSDVPYIDSAGVGAIVNAHVSFVNSGRRLGLVGVTDRVRTLFKATCVDRALLIFPTLQDAQDGLRK